MCLLTPAAGHRIAARPAGDPVAYALTRSTGTLVGKDTGADSRKSSREPFVLGRRNGARKVSRYMFNQPS